MFQHKSVIEYGIIGLGRFGYALSKTLADAGKEILVIDSDEEKIKQIRNIAESAFVIDSLSKDTLQDAGIQNCGTVIVCISISIIAKKLFNLPRIISRLNNPSKGEIYDKLNIDYINMEDEEIQESKNILFKK